MTPFPPPVGQASRHRLWRLAANTSDGADGLAGLRVGAVLVMLTAAAIYSGNMLVAQRLMIMIGGVVAFLGYNMRFPWQRRAQLFMGNAGSAFLGFVIAWVAANRLRTPAIRSARCSRCGLCRPR